MNYPLATETWDDAELKALDEVIRSRRFTMGPKVAEFERLFADHFGSRHAVMANSGSSANLLAIAGAVYMPNSPLKPGDEVLVPAVSWSTTYYPIHQLGLTLSFVDIDPNTLNFDLNKLEDSITDMTRAIFAVNLLGNPNDFDALRDICRRHDLILMEDNCESMGARFGDKAAGAQGLCGTFSTFFSHHIATMEGGLVVTDDTALYNVMVSLRAHGWTREQPVDSHLRVDGDPFLNLFRFVLPGYNLRPIEMEGALGIEQIKKLPEFVRLRRKNAKRFQEIFGGMADVRIQQEIGESSWFGFSLVLQNALAGRRADVVKKLIASGVECRPIVAGNFLRNPVIQHLRHVVHQQIKAADEIDQNGLFIGNHHYEISQKLSEVRDLFDQMPRG